MPDYTVYLAGPMRGKPRYNYDLFTRAAQHIRETTGWRLFSPSENDTMRGFQFDKSLEDQPEYKMAETWKWNYRALSECDGIVFLDGWEHSAGCRDEAVVAMNCGLDSYHWCDDDGGTLSAIGHLVCQHVLQRREPLAIEHQPEPDTDKPDGEDILHEAYRLTTGDRQNQYGSPDQDFARTAAMWSALFGRHFETHEVAMAMVCLKLSRLTWSPAKRDSWTDAAGYVRCGWLCTEPE